MTARTRLKDRFLTHNREPLSEARLALVRLTRRDLRVVVDTRNAAKDLKNKSGVVTL